MLRQLVKTKFMEGDISADLRVLTSDELVIQPTDELQAILKDEHLNC